MRLVILPILRWVAAHGPAPPQRLIELQLLLFDFINSRYKTNSQHRLLTCKVREVQPWAYILVLNARNAPGIASA